MARKTLLPVSGLSIIFFIKPKLNKQKIKILHLSHTDIREDSRILKELDAIQNLKNTEIFAIGLYRKQPKQHPVKNVKLLTIQKNKFFLNFPFLRFVRHAAIFYDFLRHSLFVKPHIVHCHDNYVLPVGWILSLCHKSLLIYDAHELESQKNGQSSFESKLTFWFEKIAWKKIKLFLSVSPKIIEWYNQKFGKKNSVLILNAPKNPRINHNQTKIKSKRGKLFHKHFKIPQGRKVFVYLGHLYFGRGIEILIKVFKNERIRSHLVFIGSNDTVGARKLVGKSKKIHFYPPVCHERVVGICRDADYGFCLIQDVSLSDRFCLPNKLFEYAFAGIPVVASRLPEIMRYVKKYRLGLCVDDCEKKLVHTLLKIQNDRVVKKIDQEKIKELRWENQQKKICLKYKELLKKINQKP